MNRITWSISARPFDSAGPVTAKTAARTQAVPRVMSMSKQPGQFNMHCQVQRSQDSRCCNMVDSYTWQFSQGSRWSMTMVVCSVLRWLIRTESHVSNPPFVISRRYHAEINETTLTVTLNADLIWIWRRCYMLTYSPDRCKLGPCETSTNQPITLSYCISCEIYLSTASQGRCTHT